jgi:predicted adenine nucleotide alpha hydrolase (AANH) superfamily ATPase
MHLKKIDITYWLEFDMRMERTALYAFENDFQAIATTNSTSRWKDEKQVDDSGFRAAEKYEGIKYWQYMAI